MKNTAPHKKKLRVTDAALRGIMTKVMQKTKQDIRSCGFTPQAFPKEVVGDKYEDWTTSIDHEAQQYFVSLMTRQFPGIGIIGEEDGVLPVSSDGNEGSYFLIDPIDGTGALLRRQPASFGPMLTWIQDGVVKGAFVGNIDTGRIFGFGPDSSDVWVTEIPSIHAGWKVETDPRKKDIWDMRVLLRDHPERHSALSRKTIGRSEKKVLVMDGGIGVWMSHLWLGAADIVFMKPGHQIPWDWSPIVGISQKLGFVFLKPGTDEGWEEYVPEISKEIVYRNHDIAIVHRNHLESLTQ